jgi:hypothetical protein
VKKKAPDAMFSDLDKWRCLKRELRFRIHVYPKMIATGKMSEAEAAREIALMGAITDDYARLIDDQQPKLDLPQTDTHPPQ